MKVVKSIAVVLAFSCTDVNAQSRETYNANEVPQNIEVNLSGYQGVGNVLFDNGPLITSVGTGVGGADESILQDIALGMTTLGSAHTGDFRVADEFTIAGGDWDIETITFFAYQTGSIASTITEVNLQIWDGVPGEPGSNVVFGDETTNRMSSTVFSNILRVVEGDSGISSLRQIAASTVDVNMTLSPGTYWLDWSSIGSGTSGPWAPPITIAGQSSTGNSLQSNLGVWGEILDLGSLTPLGLPFIIEGNVVVSDADLALSIINNALGDVSFGDLVTFTQTLTNNGPGDANNAVVTANIPNGLQYQSNDCGAMLSGSDVVWSVGTVTANDSPSCNIVTTVNGFGQLTVTATATADESDSVAANNVGSSTINGPTRVIPTLGQYGLMVLLLGMIFVVRRKFI